MLVRESKKESMLGSSTKPPMYLPRISSASDFEAFKKIAAADFVEANPTFADWQRNHRERVDLYSAGHRIVEVPVSADRFIGFCRDNSKACNFNSLLELAEVLGKA